KATFKIPTTVKPGKYYLLHRVDSTSKNIEVSESNNIKAIAVTILAKPDLAPTAVKLSKTSANAGTSVGVSYTITNKGGSATGTSYTGFYLSTSATSVAGPLVGVSTLTSLAGGKSAQLSRSFTIPATLKAGTYYVLVRADYNSKIAESSESNNIIAAKIVVYAAKLADLQVISAKLSSTKTAFRPGQTVGVTVTVKNTGVLSTGTWTIGRYISANTTISTADPYLGFNTRSSLAPGATSTFTVYSSIPKNQKAGTWYVGAYLDHKYAIKEILESNNKTAGLKISVIATADLLSKTLTTNKPYYKPGETVSFATTYQNIGTASTGTFYAGLRLSTNSFISSSDPLMKTVARASLTPGASGSLSSSFKLPTTTKPGIYYIGVRLDDQLKIAEISESNNVKWVKVTVQDPLTKKADLIPYLTKPSKTAYIAGQTMYVSGYERNIGNVTATSHSFRVYLSRYTTSISGAKYLKNVTVSSLAANGLKSIAGNISIPANTASGTWYVQFRADHAGQVSELQEGNNIASVKVAITALADLRSLSMSTDKAFYTPGSTAKVTWSEYNLGGANAGAYTTGLYLSTNTAISGADKLMKTLSRSGLAASKSLSTSTSIVIPKATAAGTYYLGVWLDNGNKVTESSNTNNFRVVKITVTSTALKPDLYISSFTSTTTSYKAGQTFSVSGVGRNIGKASAGTFRIGYYLSSNSLISTGDIFLGYKTVSSLGVGGSVSLFKYVKLPVGTKSGTWYIGALMDYQAKVSEGVETNNYRAKPIKVTAVPDLSALKISTSVAYYKPGAKMLVTISERNLGGLTAGTHTVGVYLSTNTFISTSKKLLYNFTVSSLGAGATFTKSAYVTLPSNTVPGNYYLGMYSDNGNKIAEASEGNQTRSWKFTVQSTSLKPDLIPYLFKPAKTAYKVGETLSWSGYERNVGGSTAGSHYFRVYLCKTSYYTTAKGYCFLAKNLLKSSLAKNGLTSVASSWKIPTSVGHGTWYVIGSADHLKQVGESIETNNVASIKISVAGLADLTPYSLALNKYSFKPGETITSYLRERNIGGLTTPKYYTRYYLSTDKTITSSDLLLKTVYRASLTPGAISPTYTTGLLIPKGLKAGTYYLGVYSDALNQVSETTNANNTYSRTTTVLALTTKPDLSTTDFKTTTTSYTASSTVYTSGYVKNIGGVNASAFRVSYYLSTDSNITTADTLLRSVNRSGLAAGGQSSLATSFKFPANLKAGTYYVGVYIDDLNQVSELTEANNRRANGVKFVARADLDIDYFRTSKGYYKPGETVTIYLRERNLGGATAGTHTIRVYVSTNSTISTADTYIGATTVTSLGSGATTTRTLNLKMPSKGAGTYYIGAYADIENKVPEITSANNSIYQRVTVPSTSIKPDLLPEYTYISAATMTGGATVYVSGRVRNAGKLSSGLYKVSYYIHSSSYLPSTLKPVAVVNKTSLAAGGISSLSRSLPVPTTAKSGTWYVHIRVDSANQVSESNESNNFWVQAVPVVAKADLAVLSIKTSKTSYKPGEKVSVTYVLRNQGSVDAKAFYTRAYRSTNSTITTSDTYRAQRYDAIVAAGQTITRTISFTMASLPKGAKYYYGVYADYSNKVSEPTTANNRKAAAVITVL
ncbi:MAG: hypothetical protein KC502_20730, partial [Myxococcales bacterium]|nr:hypothetical protein [Myxococcales bacterium]